MMGKERGMLDGKELRISGGAVGLEARKTLENLPRPRIFGRRVYSEMPLVRSLSADVTMTGS